MNWDVYQLLPGVSDLSFYALLWGCEIDFVWEWDFLYYKIGFLNDIMEPWKIGVMDEFGWLGVSLIWIKNYTVTEKAGKFLVVSSVHCFNQLSMAFWCLKVWYAVGYILLWELPLKTKELAIEISCWKWMLSFLLYKIVVVSGAVLSSC